MKHHPLKKILSVGTTVAIVAVVALLKVGGAAALGGGGLDGDRIASDVAREYRTMGVPTTKVDCEDLDAEVGATATCAVATTMGATQRVRVTARAVEGRTVSYDLAPVR